MNPSDPVGDRLDFMAEVISQYIRSDTGRRLALDWYEARRLARVIDDALDERDPYEHGAPQGRPAEQDRGPAEPPLDPAGGDATGPLGS